MQARTAVIAIAALVLSAPAAAACELPGGDLKRSPLQTRRPVIGEDARITSGYGMRHHPLLAVKRMHNGVDWAAPTGTQVVAAGPGRVVSTRVDGEYGNVVRVDHGGGWQTLYAQLAAFDVSEGDCVGVRGPIGKVGATGIASGPHLHFEVHFNGQPLDPLSIATQQ